MLVVLVFSAVVICGYEGTSKKLMFTLLTFVVISIIGLSINNGEGWKKTIFTNHNKTISKEIKVEELSIKNDSYRPKVTFDFSEEGGKVEEIYFKLTPNDVEKKY